MASQQDPRDWTRALREAAPLLGLGTSLAVTVALALAAGYWVDGRLGTKPLFFLVGAAFGVAGALLQIYKLGRRP
jgi:F0F1-type ATP synthase assembly protein I